MPTYDLKVIVTYEWEVVADSEKEAREQALLYQDHAHSGEIYSIDAFEQEEFEVE